MDTDDLSEMAYETISRAYDVLDVLRSEIGASAKEFKTEDEFLKGTIEFLKEILDDPRDYLDGWDHLNIVNMRQFVNGVKGLITYVEQTLKTPRSERGKTGFERSCQR